MIIIRNNIILGKPKVFLMQACRGSDLQDGEEVEDDDVSNTAHDDNDDIEDDIKVTVPNDADTLIAYATTPGKLNIIYLNTNCMNRHPLKYSVYPQR